MLAWDEQQIAEETFLEVPAYLRAFALELECVRRRVKPAGLFVVPAKHLPPCLRYVGKLGLHTIVRPVGNGVAYAQTNPARRTRLSAEQRVRLLVAGSRADAKLLAARIDPLDVRGLGAMLGYPSCCIAAAAERDTLVWDAAAREFRQTNLKAAAVAESDKLDFHCNTFLNESSLSELGPVCLVAHYPCQFACPESIRVGEMNLDCCARKWPEWAATVFYLLRAPLIYWSDRTWPSGFWDENCGMVFVSGRVLVNGVCGIEGPLPSKSLGSHKTPAGDLPIGVRRVQVTKDFVISRDGGLELSRTGVPWILDWSNGRIALVGS